MNAITTSGTGAKALNEPNLIQASLPENGNIPNNTVPLVIYRNVFQEPTDDPAAFEELFEGNGWNDTWRNGIYHYHHYHSTAHEVLGVVRGTARVQFGGDGGTVQSIAPGDVIVIPAGVAHKNLGASRELVIVGAYPEGQEPDMCYGKDSDRPKADQNVSQVPLPKSDPVYGQDGPLTEIWRETEEESGKREKQKYESGTHRGRKS